MFYGVAGNRSHQVANALRRLDKELLFEGYMTYSRENSIAYARKYWNKVCSDGFVGSSRSENYFKIADPSTKRFVVEQNVALNKVSDRLLDAQGKVVMTWDDLDDCAHFMSCAIGKPPGKDASGGLAIKSDFPTNGPYGILSANSLFEFLPKLTDVTLVTHFTKQTFDESKKLLQEEGAQVGDLLFFWNEAKGKYGHVAMLLPDEFICCHTYARCDVEKGSWELFDSGPFGICTAVSIRPK